MSSILFLKKSAKPWAVWWVAAVMSRRRPSTV